jgi:hypothetical protein
MIMEFNKVKNLVLAVYSTAFSKKSNKDYIIINSKEYNSVIGIGKTEYLSWLDAYDRFNKEKNEKID